MSAMLCSHALGWRRLGPGQAMRWLSLVKVCKDQAAVGSHLEWRLTERRRIRTHPARHLALEEQQILEDPSRSTTITFLQKIDHGLRIMLPPLCIKPFRAHAGDGRQDVDPYLRHLRDMQLYITCPGTLRQTKAAHLVERDTVSSAEHGNARSKCVTKVRG